MVNDPIESSSRKKPIQLWNPMDNIFGFLVNITANIESIPKKYNNGDQLLNNTELTWKWRKVCKYLMVKI